MPNGAAPSNNITFVAGDFDTEVHKEHTYSGAVDMHGLHPSTSKKGKLTVNFTMNKNMVKGLRKTKLNQDMWLVSRSKQASHKYSSLQPVRSVRLQKPLENLTSGSALSTQNVDCIYTPSVFMPMGSSSVTTIIFYFDSITVVLKNYK
jgi:hypothetical protein